MMMKRLFVLSTFALLWSFFTMAQGAREIPDVKVRTLDGKEVSLQKWVLAGKKTTVISFWATWCTPCKRELDNTNDFVEEWSKRYHARFVAISIDNSRNVHKVAPFVKGKGWKYEILLDPNGNTRRALNYMMIPYLIIVDKEGKIVYRHVGYQEGDELEVEEQLMKLAQQK